MSCCRDTLRWLPATTDLPIGVKIWMIGSAWIHLYESSSKIRLPPPIHSARFTENGGLPVVADCFDPATAPRLADQNPHLADAPTTKQVHVVKDGPDGGAVREAANAFDGRPPSRKGRQTPQEQRCAQDEAGLQRKACEVKLLLKFQFRVTNVSE